MNTTSSKPPENGDHKETSIVINGRPTTVTEKELSYSQIVALAFDPPPSGDNVVITITYRRGQGDKPEGTLIEGQTVKVKDGMIFNVTSTDKS